MKQPKMVWTDEVNFGFHVEGNEIVVDECVGIAAEDALSMFPSWAIDSAARSADWKARYQHKEDK